MSGLPRAPCPASGPGQPPTSPSASAGPRPGKRRVAGGSRPCRAGHHLLPGHTPASFQLKFLPGSSSAPPRPYPLPAPSQLLGERLKEVGPAPRGHLPGVLPSVLRPGAPACEPTALLWGWSRRGSRGWGHCSTKARGQGRGQAPRACGRLWRLPWPVRSRLPPTRAPGRGWPEGLETHFPVGRTTSEDFRPVGKAWLGKEQ